MQASSHTTKSPDLGFTVLEVLVAMLVSGLILTAFTGFYLGEQRANRHHQVEVESSQALRTALEQMTRDLRVAGKNMTSAALGGNFPFVTADAAQVEFELDANDDGIVSNTVSEHKGFRLTGTTLESYDGSNWNALADNISTLQFSYKDCTGAALPPPVTSPGTSIASVDVSLTVTRPIVGGIPVSRTETDSVRLRNKRCP